MDLLTWITNVIEDVKFSYVDKVCQRQSVAWKKLHF